MKSIYPFSIAPISVARRERFIHHMGHIRMMSAAQSFLSGAISKTINMPNEATVEDVLDAYEQSWRHGIKAMALYRDGSKLSQPLSAKSDSAISAEAASAKESEIELRIEQATAEAVTEALARARAEWEQERQLPRQRARRPRRRSRFAVAYRHGAAASLRRPGRGEQGLPAHGRIRGWHNRRDLYRHAQGGRGLRSMINCFAIAISKGLQYGVPLEEFVETFTFTRFEPQGMVSGHPNIKMATSIIDYVFRVLGLEYLGAPI